MFIYLLKEVKGGNFNYLNIDPYLVTYYWKGLLTGTRYT